MHANGDAAFAFEVHGVQVLGLELARGDGAGLEQELVGQRALTVIDMRDDREVPYVAGHVWLVTLAGPHARKLTIPGAAASGTLRKYTDFASELGARSVSEEVPAAATNTQSSTDFTDFTEWNSRFESVKSGKSVDDSRQTLGAGGGLEGWKVRGGAGRLKGRPRISSPPQPRGRMLNIGAAPSLPPFGRGGVTLAGAGLPPG